HRHRSGRSTTLQLESKADIDQPLLTDRDFMSTRPSHRVDYINIYFCKHKPILPASKNEGSIFSFTAFPLSINGKLISCAALNPSPLWTRKTNEPKFFCPFPLDKR